MATTLHHQPRRHVRADNRQWLLAPPLHPCAASCLPACPPASCLPACRLSALCARTLVLEKYCCLVRRSFCSGLKYVDGST